MIDSGGDNPNIHIRPLGGGDVIICDCSEELAAEVAHLLYSVVGGIGAYSGGGWARPRLLIRQPLRPRLTSFTR